MKSLGERKFICLRFSATDLLSFLESIGCSPQVQGKEPGSMIEIPGDARVIKVGASYQDSLEIILETDAEEAKTFFGCYVWNNVDWPKMSVEPAIIREAVS
jgi:hypothetical protein